MQHIWLVMLHTNSGKSGCAGSMSLVQKTALSLSLPASLDQVQAMALQCTASIQHVADTGNCAAINPLDNIPAQQTAKHAGGMLLVGCSITMKQSE